MLAIIGTRAYKIKVLYNNYRLSELIVLYNNIKAK
jgi:hypothetical protein